MVLLLLLLLLVIIIIIMWMFFVVRENTLRNTAYNHYHYYFLPVFGSISEFTEGLREEEPTSIWFYIWVCGGFTGGGTYQYLVLHLSLRRVYGRRNLPVFGSTSEFTEGLRE